jgi:hypothetical protein
MGVIPMTIIAYHRNPVHAKSRLVDLGLFFLSRGDIRSVLAITRLIERRGYRHE